MPFFLPRRLIELEYLGSEPDPERDAEAEPYRDSMDFAFFAANFGYSRADYDALTPAEKLFLVKAWEDRQLSISHMIYNAVFTATYNVNRPRRKRALKLWQKSRVRKADMEVIEDNLEVIREADKNDGTDWVRKIYEKNGLKIPEGV